MSTYLNAYQLLSDVRYAVNEHSTDLVNGEDNTGAYQNEYLMGKINSAQRYIHSFLSKRFKEFFLESKTIPGVDSVFELPWDCGAVRYFKDENGHKVSIIDVDQIHTARSVGSDNLYYRKGNNLILDKAGVTETYTLFYYKKPREINQGKAQAGGLGSITLASPAKKIVSYYDGMIIENITQDWVDTISEYAATRIATISETASADNYYGIVPDLPEMFHEFIAPIAAYKTKLEFPVSQEAPKPGVLGDINEAIVSAAMAYTGELGATPEDVFCDQSPNQSFYNIPGH